MIIDEHIITAFEIGAAVGFIVGSLLTAIVGAYGHRVSCPGAKGKRDA